MVTNARVHTAEPGARPASAIAVRGGRIVAVGDDVSAFRGPKTRLIDARGATVIPGLIDSHCHMAGLGASLEMLDLRGVSSAAQVADMVRKASAGKKPGEWITGRSWDQTLWGGAFPTHELLSAAAPANPVYLTVFSHGGSSKKPPFLA